MKPIIDPSTLTEEQREAIKAEYQNRANYCAYSDECDKYHIIYSSEMRLLKNIFGKSFFEKGGEG